MLRGSCDGDPHNIRDEPRAVAVSEVIRFFNDVAEREGVPGVSQGLQDCSWWRYSLLKR